MEPTSGEAWVAGFSIRTESEAIKERIGYMSQRFGLYEDLTVIENILFYADLYEVAEAGAAGPHRAAARIQQPHALQGPGWRASSPAG